MAKKQKRTKARGATKSAAASTSRATTPTTGTFRITCRLIDRQTRQGVAGLRVEAWDKDLICDDLVGSAVTDEQGVARIDVTESYFKELFLDRHPDLFFKVFREKELVTSTEDSVLWNVATGDTEVVIEVATASADQPEETCLVRGSVRDMDGNSLNGIVVRAFDKDLRKEVLLGETTTKVGEYEVRYSERQFFRTEKGNANLVVKAFAADDSLLVVSPVLFNAPLTARVDLIVPAEKWRPPTLFEKIDLALTPLLDDLRMQDLEENTQHQDLNFLSGETGFDKRVLARFAIAHKLAKHGIQAEFWFALLGGSIFEFAETQSLEEQVTALLDSLSSLDAGAVRKSLTRALDQKDIPEAFRERVGDWIETFLIFAARRSIDGTAKPTFTRLALEHAGIESADKQEAFSRLFNQQKSLTPELLRTLEKDKAFKQEQIADLRASFQLSDLTRGDFSVVRMLKEEFDVRQPEHIRKLAKKSESEWVSLVKEKHAAGDIQLPIGGADIAGQPFPAAEVYGKTLERQFREAFPTAAFAGGLERALSNGGTRGLRHADGLSRFLQRREDFELLNTPVDEYLKSDTESDPQSPARDEDFRLELKAAQRVFKLAPTFEATDALLADDLHSAQQVYRMGESEFVRRYADTPGFTAETAHVAWNRAADTYATVLTVVADLKALDAEALPLALKNDNEVLATFPNWNKLFKTGDLCECEHCRSALSPAAYFADLLTFLKDRKAAKSPKQPGAPIPTVKDILFARRPDLGFLELNCANALTPLPYIDVVCEVLEDAVDHEHANHLELTPIVGAAGDATAAVAKALKDSFKEQVNRGKEQIEVGENVTLSQVKPSDPDQWVVHGDNATYLLKKGAAGSISAEILRNTKASAAELRAHPQYVNPKAYETLRAAKYPLTLPFDLFAEDVRAAFQKTNLQRWDLMRTLRGRAAPNNPTDGDIAAEYFGISADATAPLDEKRLIVGAAATIAGQQARWGEAGAGWLDRVGNVHTFLQKTSLEYQQLLGLLDLEFINPEGDITVHHLDPSCDTDRKAIQVLDATKLDRIHRFLRLWRKLKGWKMWELDLAITRIGAGVLDEPFLVNLFYFSRLRKRLGENTTVEQICALFDDLNTKRRFTKLHDKREDALYQSLFLNKRLVNPLDPALEIDPATNDIRPALDAVNGQRTQPRLVDHHPVMLAALGIREGDLVLLETLTKASDGKPYITADLTLGNLSFLWRHAWLSKLLKFKAEEWKTILKLFQQDILRFDSPEAAWQFVERIDLVKAAGFTPDELNWLLAADRSSKAATKETDAARFLAAVRKDLQAIKEEYDPASSQYASLPSANDVDSLTALLTSLLQKLNYDDTDVNGFLKTLRGSVSLEADVQDLGAFTFPPAVTAASIPIQHDQVRKLFRFTGVMTEAQRALLNTNAPSAPATRNVAYRNAIADLFQQSQAARENYASVEVEVSLPSGVTLPADRPSLPIRYNSTTHKLGFTGVMTDAERLALKNVAGNPAGAIEELYQLPRMAVKFFEPVFTAPLDALPSAVDFTTQLPPDVAAKTSYDVEQRLLRFADIMSNAEKTQIRALSVDPDYVAAVDSLAAQPHTIRSQDDRVWVTDDDLDVAQPGNTTYPERLANAARKALKYLSAAVVENAIVREGSVQLGLTEALTRQLLTAFVVVPIVPGRIVGPTKTTLMAHLAGNYKTDSTAFSGWFWAHRVAAIWKRWKITLAEVEQIITLTSDAQLLDFGRLPLDDIDRPTIAPIDRFLRTNQLLRLRDSLPETEVTLLEVLGRLRAGSYSTAAAFAANVQRLNETWPAADVEALTDALDLAYPKDYLLAETWERIRRAFHYLENLHAGVDTAADFAAAAMTDVHAKRVKELLRSKFGTETWLALSAEIQDVLRERKRDALVAYLRATSGKWEDTNELYAYYLLDVEMSSCQLTSRLVQASGSVQLFVQRCFMGLEQPAVVVEAGGATGDSAWRWWQWMRKYRVWEANRKVFLWPENVIEPELKKDRSPFFKDMENELLQNELNQHTVETAFSNYLEKLGGVAQLEIAGFYQEDDGDNAIVHVFGRTAGAEPHLYYYRRYDYRQWTTWEKVEVDIQGDYLIPAVVNRRLFLFWPVFTEVPDEAGNSRMTVPAPGQRRFTPDQTTKRLRLQMAVSEYRQGKWSPKKVSTDFDQSAEYRIEIVKQHYAFHFIDRSNVDGRVRIQYEGYSVGSKAANTKTIVDLENTAADTEKARKTAFEENEKAQTALTKARAAVAAVQKTLDLTNIIIPVANAIVGISADPVRTVRAVYGLVNSPGWLDSTEPGYVQGYLSPASAAYISAGTTVTTVQEAAAADAGRDAQTFMNALGTLDVAFRTVRTRALEVGLDNLNKQNLPALATAAQEAAQSAVDAGVEALRTIKLFKDAAARAADADARELEEATAASIEASEALENFTPDYARQAALFGAFEISGCTGVPEKADPVGTFTHAIRPEQASVGDDAAFLKWVELSSRRDAPPQDDFTLVNHLVAWPAVSDTLVLGQTPDRFKMTAAWHGSYLDKLGLDSNPSYNKTGTWLPFFYGDKKRTFFVLPCSQFKDAGKPDVRGYYPKLKSYLNETFAFDTAGMNAAGIGFDLQQYLGYLVALSEDRIQFQKFHFKTFYHPFVCDFARLVYNPLEGIPSLMSRETQRKNSGFSFEESYQPASAVVKLPPQYPLLVNCYPNEDVDFTPDGAYSPYNWELFFHAPLLIANSLSKNQRFEEAREWYHFIFNPLGLEGATLGGSSMSKYWITKPFFETTDKQYVQQRIDNIMRMLSGDTSLPDFSEQAKRDLEGQVLDWRTNPFEPHRIANYRTVAYQKTVVMKYLDNLIAWADNLFRQESLESLNEATQLYILAAEILGPRPKTIPPRARPPVESFNELESQFDAFPNALVEVENLIPQLAGSGQSEAEIRSYTAVAPQRSTAPLPMLYFCIPPNDKMLGYWDTVADRLHKIRHCMNIEGVSRQLALFEPPIDPAALVKAIAGGADIGSALTDLNAPLPLYRFNVLLQKANEVCNDVKALGGALLAALEKKDAEAIALLRQGQESRLLEAVKAVREKQVEEAKENLDGIKKARAVTEVRRDHYRDIERLIAKETLHIDKMAEARTLSEVAQGIMLGASIISYLPAINLGASGWGGTPLAAFKIGGLELGQAASLASDVLSFLSQIATNDAAMASVQAGFERRSEDWTFQELLADKELEQIDRQIASAELRIAIAEKERDNHLTQIENAKAIDVFMRSKYTSQELYQWQVGQIAGVYFQSYKLAYDLAKRAERCFRFELGVQDGSYINFGYWDSLKKGLLSGEKLQYDLRRLETAYLENNRREFELTKHVSLAVLDPLALVKLRETGRCFVRLPEELFDLDYPGHYFRRIKSVSLTLPCVVGPYTTISCTLRLLKNSIRINTAGDYARNTSEGLPADDGRFVENNIPVKAIAASTAQNDSGVFELSFRDERYLPFEGAGVVSEWSLELFNDPGKPDFGRPLRQFDYGSIADAILHIKYTAREDAGAFKNRAVAHLREYLSESETGRTPSLRLFNLRQEFPTQWHRFLNPTSALSGNTLEVEMSSSLFPFRDGDKTLKINSVSLLARATGGDYSATLVPRPLGALPTMKLARVNQYGGLLVNQLDVPTLGIQVKIVPTDPPAKWQLKMTRDGGGNLELEDVLLVLGYEWE